MKKIKIFLACSEELKEEREKFADLVGHLNLSLEKRGIMIYLVKWEYLDSSMGPKHKQDEYNEELRNCELCLVMYWTRFGDYTKEELDIAYQGLCDGGNPKKLYVFFKEGDGISPELQAFRDSFPKNYGHFYCHFQNMDTLKAEFLLKFIDYQGLYLKENFIDVKDSQVTIDGKVYVELKNVPFVGNNEEYNLLLKNINKTQKLLSVTDLDDPDYREYVKELVDLKKKQKMMEESLWHTALMITELSTRRCSERLERAMQLFSQGDNKGAQAVLNEEEISRDIQHNIHLIRLGEEGSRGLEININELLLKIQTLQNEHAEGWFRHVNQLYERCVENGRGKIAKKIFAKVLFEYGEFLQNQNQFTKALSVNQEALVLYRELMHLDNGAYEFDLAKVLNNLAELYSNIQRYSESETMFLECLEICRHLSVSNPNAYEPNLANVLDNLACLYSDIQCYSESEVMYLECLEIRRRLCISNLDVYEPDLAFTLNNLASLYHKIQHHSESEAMYLECLDIRSRLSASNPDAYEPDFASTLNNLASLYADMLLDSESEMIYLEGLKIYRRLSASNPDVYEPDLALTLNNLASLYYETQRYSESEAMYLEGLDVYRHLSASNPDVYEPNLALTLNNLASLYSDIQRYSESEAMYLESLEIYNRLSITNPEAHEPDLAMTLHNLADLYSDTQRYSESKMMLIKCMDIYHRLEEKNSTLYEDEIKIVGESLAEL